MQTKTKKIVSLRGLATVAIMSAISYVLMMLEFSVPLVPSFLKFDFSELPALITSFAFGPLYGMAVCLVKNLLHLPFTQTGGVGELSNFLLGAIFVGCAGLIYRFMNNLKGALIGSVVGALAMSIIQLATNYFIVYPVYTNFMPMDAIIGMYKAIFPGVNNLFDCLVVFNLPFTFVKGILSTALCFVVYKKISPLLKNGIKSRKKNV